MTTPREEWQFDTPRIGRRVLVFDEVGSTNTLAAGIAAPDADGLVVLAENQTAGRGRFGRVWRSRPGSSLLASVVLFPPAELRRASILTAWAAVAVGRTIDELAGVPARVKWPNDLLIGGKKVCGILIEQARAVVVGIGLNLNQTAEEFTAAELPDATSLATAAGTGVDLRTAVEALVRHLDTEYGHLLGGNRAAVERDWERRTELVGRPVVVELAVGGTVTGRMTRLGFDQLEVETPGGDLLTIAPESVAHVRAVD